MQLILHIGTEKTGSTAIQQHLLANRTLLAERGTHLCQSAGEGNHRALVAAFMPDDAHDDFLRSQELLEPAARVAWRRAFLEDFVAEVESAKSRADRFVVSSEHFHSRLLQRESVASLAAFLTGSFSDVSVICYLRRQDEMALSFYSEKLRAGFVPPEMLPLSKTPRRDGSLPPFFDFDSLLARWGDAFGPARVRPRLFQAESLADADVVQDFFQAAGLGAPQARLPHAANASLSRAAQAALRRYNEMCGGHEPSARDRHRVIRQQLVDYLQRQPRGDSGQLPTREEARAFYDAFATSNARVARQWFQRRTLFVEDFSAYPEQHESAGWSQAAGLLAGFLAEQGNALARET